MNWSYKLGQILFVCFVCMMGLSTIGAPALGQDALGLTASTAHLEGLSNFDSLSLRLSNSGKTVYAYSRITGRWSKLAVEFDKDFPFQPSRAGIFSVFRTKDKLFAFDEKRGRFVSVDLPQPTQRVTEIFSGGCVAWNGRRAFGFSSARGSWEFVDLQTGEITPEMHSDFATIKDGSRIVNFSFVTGTWDVIDLNSDD